MPQELKSIQSGRARRAACRRAAARLGLLSVLLAAGAAPAAMDMAPLPIQRNVANYPEPAVTLVRQDGKRVAFRKELDDGRPVVLAFIFTSCTAICPAISQTLAQFQTLSAAAGRHPHIVSVTIDPEQDTPAELRAYAARFHAGADWQHYTGASADVVEVQRAFGVFAGDKMNHAAVYFLRPAPGAPWVRLAGMVPAQRLMQELEAATQISRAP